MCKVEKQTKAIQFTCVFHHRQTIVSTLFSLWIRFRGFHIPESWTSALLKTVTKKDFVILKYLIEQGQLETEPFWQTYELCHILRLQYLLFVIHFIRPIGTIPHDTLTDMLSIILILQFNSKQEIVSVKSVSSIPQLHSWSALKYFIGYKKCLY